MNRTPWIAAAFALALAGGGAASAQRLTEQFIPVGESPGVSGVSAVIGRVVSVDPTRGLLVVEVDGRPVSYVMTPDSDIWLDRSDERMATLGVNMTALEVGDLVEIKGETPEAAVASTAGAAPARLADWIKIDASARD